MAESYGATSNASYDWLMSDGAGVTVAGPAVVGQFPRDVQTTSAAPVRVELQHRAARREDAGELCSRAQQLTCAGRQH
jgi:hypothetical protein